MGHVQRAARHSHLAPNLHHLLQPLENSALPSPAKNPVKQPPAGTESACILEWKFVPLYSLIKEWYFHLLLNWTPSHSNDLENTRQKDPSWWLKRVSKTTTPGLVHLWSPFQIDLTCFIHPSMSPSPPRQYLESRGPGPQSELIILCTSYLTDFSDVLSFLVESRALERLWTSMKFSL